MVGNPNVVSFFLIGAAIFAVVANRFWRTTNSSFRNFALGLYCFAAAFLIWAAIVATHPTPLDAYMSIGVLPFVAGFFALVSSATFDWAKRNRNLIFGITAAYLLAMFALRTWAYPSAPGFSDRGLIYFNAQPPILLMYVLVFAGAFMPALHVVTKQIPDRLVAALTRIFFNLIVLTGVILMVSYDDDLQYLNGYVMGAAFLGLLVIYAPKAVKEKLSA